MFETSVVARVAPSRGRMGLFTMSVLAHTAAICGAIGVSLASVEFPPMAPDEYRVAPSFATVPIPPPPGNPNGGGRPATPPPAERTDTPPPPADRITAPNVVPDDVPTAATTATVTSGDDGGSDAPGLVPGPVGVPGGDPNSIAIDVDVPPATPQPPVEQRIYHSHEVKAPVLIRRVEPVYPQSMLNIRATAVVIVECVIDRNGNVRDAEVVSNTMTPFRIAVLDAVRQWKFTPGSLRGTAVDTYMTLTVRFEVKR